MEEETQDEKGRTKMKCATAPHKRETEVHGGRGQLPSLPMPPAQPCLTRGFPDPNAAVTTVARASAIRSPVTVSIPVSHSPTITQSSFPDKLPLAEIFTGPSMSLKVTKSISILTDNS